MPIIGARKVPLGISPTTSLLSRSTYIACNIGLGRRLFLPTEADSQTFAKSFRSFPASTTSSNSGM